MTQQSRTPAREHTAERLLAASLRRSYDPEVDIEWDAPPVPGAFWLPPHRSSLWGTPLWEALSHDQRVELTKHEVASAASAGIWFETVLMQMLIRHYYDQDPTAAHAQYALTEVADECRHSVMFGRLIDRLGAPHYRAGWRDQTLGRILKSTATGAHMYASVLIAEEVLDTYQREAMADESLQPLVRMISRIHVVEETRHVRFARDELTRQVAEAGPARMAFSRLIIARAAYAVSRRLIHPDVYAAVGIAPAVGLAAARQNPHFQATLRWSATKVVDHLTQLDLIGGPGRALWRRSAFL